MSVVWIQKRLIWIRILNDGPMSIGIRLLIRIRSYVINLEEKI